MRVWYAFGMRTIFTAFLLTLFIVGLVFGGLYFYNYMFVPSTLSAGVRVQTTLPVSISIDGALKGEGTLVDIKSLSPGLRTVTLTVTDSSYSGRLKEWSRTIKLGAGTLGLVGWEFGEDEASSSGQVVTLEKADKLANSAEVTFISTPDGARISIDGADKGETSVTLPGVSPGLHAFVFSKEGYKPRTVDVQILANHTFQIHATLARESTVKPELVVIVKGPLVKILATSTGWLRVRSKPGFGGVEVAKVNPGEEYSVLEENAGWYRIKLDDGKEGWISGQYAKKTKQ